MSALITVVGSSGLLSRPIWNAVASRGHAKLRVAGRARPDDLPSDVDFVSCDIVDGRRSLAKALAGSDLVINATSYVGPDERRQQAVNVDGVSAIIDALETSGTRHFLHMSTAGVYGASRPTGEDESLWPLAPESPLSRSRADGERLVALAGGVAVRPLFVTGPSDTHFLLPLLRAHQALGAWIEGGEARLSVASSEFVGEATAGIAQAMLEGEVAGAVNIVPDEPVRVRDLIEPLLAAAGCSVTASVGTTDAQEALERFGVARRKVAQFAADYVIASSRLRKIVPGLPEVAPVTEEAAKWYMAALSRLPTQVPVSAST